MLLLELITGIFKQVGVGMLETLDLQYNDLGLLPDAQLILGHSFTPTIGAIHSGSE